MALVRVSGLPFNAIRKLAQRKLAFRTNEIISLRTERANLREKLIQALHDLIGGSSDARRRHHLLGLKRSLTAGRSLPSLTPHFQLSNVCQAGLFRLHAIDEKERQLLRDFPSLYCDQKCRSIASLAKIAKKRQVRDGVLLTSPGFYDKVYSSGDIQVRLAESPALAKGLIKYASRACTKTSPFSSLTSVAFANATENADDHIEAPIVISKKSRIRLARKVLLNNEVLKFLSTLLYLNKDIARHLYVKPNSTLSLDGRYFRFLINIHNVESFQWMDETEELRLVYQILRKRRDSQLRYDNLIDAVLNSKVVVSSREECEAFIDSLLSYGFLELDLQVSSMEPQWDTQLRNKLLSLASEAPILTEVCNSLLVLHDCAKSFERANPDGRRSLMDRAYNLLETLCINLHARAGLPAEERQQPSEREKSGEEYHLGVAKQVDEILTSGSFKRFEQTRFYSAFKKEQILYEDTRLLADLSFSRAALNRLALTMERLYDCLIMFDIARVERERMRAFFVRHYGRDATLPLLTFYEAYYTHLKCMASDDAQEVNKETPSVNEREKRKEWIRVWSHEFSKLPLEIDCDNVVHIRSESLATIKESIGYPTDGMAPYSSAAVVQFFKPKAGSPIQWVLNSAPPGHGKMISRFLHLFPHKVTHFLRSWNQALSGDILFAEASDATFFNANMHPALMPYEVSMPGSQTHSSGARSIAIQSLVVMLGKDDQLQLRHTPTERRTFVFDLGFQGQYGRAPLYWLLCEFSNNRYLLIWEMLECLNSIFLRNQNISSDSEPTAPIRLPRVVFDECVVLQREHWIVPLGALPANSRHTEWQHHLEINSWRREWSMPMEVFVTATNVGFPISSRDRILPEAQRRSKPQFIAFDNPLLTNLFSSFHSRSSPYIRIEEVLPGSEDLLPIGRDGYCAEVNVQWGIS